MGEWREDTTYALARLVKVGRPKGPKFQQVQYRGLNLGPNALHEIER
jgi:hypothetical protein